MCYDGVCSEDSYDSGHDSGYQSGYDDGYQSGRDAREWELDDYQSDVDNLTLIVERLKTALVDAGVHPNLVEAIANGN